VKTYTFVQPGEDGITPEYTSLTEQEILDEYWEYWVGKQHEVGIKEHLINRERCIEDFCVVHWAWEGTRETNATN